MSTVDKILIRLTKANSKISTVIDATYSFNKNNSFYQDLSGWDVAIVEIINPIGTILFNTTNDDGSVTGQTLPVPEVPINWLSVSGLDLLDNTYINSVNYTSTVKFQIIGKYLQLAGLAQNWSLYNLYAPAEADGAITFPNHATETGSLNPNYVGASCDDLHCVQLYINIFDAAGNDRTDLLSQLIGNSGTLTLTQGFNSVTYHFTNQAFANIDVGASNVYYDSVYGSSPAGSLTVISPAAANFNIMDEITIDIVLDQPNLSLVVSNDLNLFDIAENSDFTIEWEAWYANTDNHPRAYSFGSYGTGGAAHAVSIEGGTFYWWIAGSIVFSVSISIEGGWHHFCLQRSGDVAQLYIDGVGVQSTDSGFTQAIPSDGLPMYIASEGDDSLSNALFSNFRWNNVEAVYNPLGFTPPTSNLTSVFGTTLLLFQGNTLELELTDNSGQGSVITNGTGAYNGGNPFSGGEGSILFGTF